MADVTVNIRGDASQFRSEIEKAQDTLRQVQQSSGGSEQFMAGGSQGDASPSNAYNTSGSYSGSRTSGSGWNNLVPPTAADDRITQDVRREMQSRGVMFVPGTSNMSAVINQMGDQAERGEDAALKERAKERLDVGVVTSGQQGNDIDALNASIKELTAKISERAREQKESEITQRYEDRKAEIKDRYLHEYRSLGEKLDREEEEEIQNAGGEHINPLRESIIRANYHNRREREFEKLGMSQDDEESRLADEEEQERSDYQKEIANAMKELSAQQKRRSQIMGNYDPDSYIGQLKAQQRSLTLQRDSAATEEEAREVSDRLREVNEKIRRATSGDVQDGGVGRSGKTNAMMVASGAMNTLGSLERGDFSGAAGSGGSTMMGLGGILGGGAAKALGAIGLGIMAGSAALKQVDRSSERYENMGSLAAMRGTTSGLSGGDAIKYLSEFIPRSSYGGMTINDFGMNKEEFSTEASRRIRARGTSDNWYDETMRQIGLERSLGLQHGSMERGSQYDRYGINVTDALSRMVTILSNIEDSGVSYGDFTRVQEKYDIQQQIMSSYSNRADKPNYDVANSNLAAFSAVKGITQDARIGSDYASFQNMIQNPANERMKAIMYGTVSDIMPELGGNMALIDRAIRDPKNEGKIIQAVIERVTKEYGGTDTDIGYFTLKSLLPHIAPDRLDQYIEQFRSGEGGAGKILKDGVDKQFIGGQDRVNMAASQSSANWFAQSKEFTTEWTKHKTNVQNYLQLILDQLMGNAYSGGGVRRGGNS